jgi:hypothetical protein
MDDESNNDRHVCKACKQNSPDPSYAFPLCPQCRQQLIRRPFPIWIKIAMIIIAGLMVYSASSLPTAFIAVTASKTGRNAETVADFHSAIVEYQKILVFFPDAQEYKARLAICYLKTGAAEQASDIFKNLNEKSLSKSTIMELNSLVSNLKKKSNSKEPRP